MGILQFLKIGSWIACLAINSLGVYLALGSHNKSALIYGAFVIVTLALNCPNLSHGLDALRGSRPALIAVWMFAKLRINLWQTCTVAHVRTNGTRE